MLAKSRATGTPAPTQAVPPTATALPRPDDDQDVRPLIQRAATLAAGRRERQDRIDDLTRQLMRTGDADDAGGPVERAAAKLIAGEEPEAADAAAVRVQLANARAHHDAYSTAVVKFDREQLQPARYRAAKRIAEGRFPAWRAQVREAVGHLLDYHRAAVQMARRRDEFIAADLHVAPLGPDPIDARSFTTAGAHEEHFKRIAGHLVEGGFADAGEPLVAL